MFVLVNPFALGGRGSRDGAYMHDSFRVAQPDLALPDRGERQGGHPLEIPLKRGRPSEGTEPLFNTPKRCGG